jgi:hypothetical protein
MAGWLKRLFLKRNTTAARSALDLIQLYGAALEAHAASGSVVTDISRLPAPKETLRAALLAQISLAKDSKVREYLKGGYVMLACFQAGVGSQVIKIDCEMGPSTDLRQMAARVVAQGDAVTAWGARVTAEMELLQRELVDGRR